MPGRWRRSGSAAADPIPDEGDRKRAQFTELRKRREELRQAETPGTSNHLLTEPMANTTSRRSSPRRTADPFSSATDIHGGWQDDTEGDTSFGGRAKRRTERRSPSEHHPHQSSSFGRNAASPPAPPPADVWLCEVTTGDLQHAGTKSNVYIDVYGENGCVPKVHLNPNQEKFPRNSTVQVSLQLNDDNIGRLYKVRVSHDHSGTGPDWYLTRLVLTHVSGPNVVKEPLGRDSASTVSVGGHHASGSAAKGSTPSFHLPTDIEGEHYVFDCDAWLTKFMPAREIPARGPYVDPARLPKLVTYNVKTFTGAGDHKAGAGTDANVYVQLFGLLGDTGIRKLAQSDTHSDKFEAGHEDRFKIEAVHLGDLTKVVIGHDNSGGIMHQLKARGDAGWFLDKVVVFDPSLPGDVSFPCDRWLDAGKDDGKIERALLRARPAVAADNFTIETQTSARGEKSGIVGPVWPWVMLGGSAGKTEKLSLAPTDSKRAFRAGARDAFALCATPIGTLNTVTVGYSPTDDAAAPWLPEKLWVTTNTGDRTCWLIDGARGETGGKGWPNQRMLVLDTEKYKEEELAATAAAATSRGGSNAGGKVGRGRQHAIAITPTGLRVECWETADRPARRRGKETIDCWNREFVPSKSRTAKRNSTTDAAQFAKAYDMLDISVKRGESGLGFELGPIGSRGASVLKVIVGSPADGQLRIGDVLRTVNKRKVSGMAVDELQTIVRVAAQLDLSVLRKRAPIAKPSMAAAAVENETFLPQERSEPAPPSFSGRGTSSTFRDATSVRKAKGRRKAQKEATMLRTLLLDVPAACMGNYSALEDKLELLSREEKAQVYDTAKGGTGHAHARAVWRLVLALEVTANERIADQLDRLHIEFTTAAERVKVAAQQHTDAVKTLTAATEGGARASAAKRDADDEMIETPDSVPLQKAALDRGSAAYAATTKIDAAKKIEKRWQSELNKAHETLASKQAAVAQATKAKAVVKVRGPRQSTVCDASADPVLERATAELLKAKQNLSHADAAQRAGATRHANDSGVFPVAEAVQLATAEVKKATAAFEKADKSAQRLEKDRATGNTQLSDRQSMQSGASSPQSMATAPSKARFRKGMSEATMAKLATAIVNIAGHSKTALLSASDMFEALVDAGYRCSVIEVKEVLEQYEPLREMAEAQRRRKKHNEAAIQKWEISKRSQTKKKKNAVRSEKVARTKEARDINSRSMARVHYNPWAAALGLGVRPTPGQPAEADGRHFRYVGTSTLPWDNAERRTLGGVSHQSWYHGAKQVAEATSGMQM